jgi:hypothetical protein
LVGGWTKGSTKALETISLELMMEGHFEKAGGDGPRTRQSHWRCNPQS